MNLIEVASSILGMTMTEKEVIEKYELDIDSSELLEEMSEYNIELCAGCGVWKETCDVDENSTTGNRSI